MLTFPGIVPADILLPKNGIELEKWAVIACDQFTSQPEYWHEAESFVENEPSTLNLIQPEAFLSNAEGAEKINRTMVEYLSTGILETAVKEGFVALRRETTAGPRYGLVAAIDLEEYDFRTGKGLVRATEGTVTERLPARVEIRAGAPVELPHIMVLIDDPDFSVIEPAFDNGEPLYGFNLMAGSGRITGRSVTGECLKDISNALWRLEAKSGGFLYAVGDGNHSLAAAKLHWENLKKKLPAGDTHPARYALVELVNLRSPAQKFEPIHRVVFNAGMAELVSEFIAYLKHKNFGYSEDGKENVPNLIRFICADSEIPICITGSGGLLPVAIVQSFLDEWLSNHPEASLDYIHGEQDLRQLSVENNTGILLQSIDKESFFEGIRSGGPLPRKTFSMGEARDKRFYLESRKIV